MENKKEQITKRISQLNEIKIPVPTALQLHCRNPMLNRVQRREDKRYFEDVREQGRKLNRELSRMNREENRRNKVGNGLGMVGNTKFIGSPVVNESTFKLPSSPRRVQTRLNRYR